VIIQKKNVVENHFDKMMSGKEYQEYQFNLQRMNIKDRKIAQALLDFGLQKKACLDIGPGTGRWLTFMTKNGAEWKAAIDISAEVIERCNKLCNETQKANIECEKFNFDDNTVDIIIAIEVLEHIRDPTMFISEIVRVSSDGALILMTIPNIVSFISRIRMAFGLLPVAIAADPTHVGFYRKKDLKNLFKPHGLIPKFIPTSFSLNPLNPKSRLRIRTSSLFSSLDDSTVFSMIVNKTQKIL
jgi:2-polyprenyl-3-methyl-5-hydroxy-6-metoxy-1,4-benzoquinol methylase